MELETEISPSTAILNGSSVWVLDQTEQEVLQKSFFGKGVLSRGKPSFFVKQVGNSETGMRSPFHKQGNFLSATESTESQSVQEVLEPLQLGFEEAFYLVQTG